MADRVTDAMRTFYKLNTQLLQVDDNREEVRDTDVLDSCFVAMVGPPGLESLEHYSRYAIFSRIDYLRMTTVNL
jgi:hypothetical protein